MIFGFADHVDKDFALRCLSWSHSALMLAVSHGPWILNMIDRYIYFGLNAFLINVRDRDHPTSCPRKLATRTGPVGYFHLHEIGKGIVDLTPRDELDMSSIYTYYTGQDKSGLRKDLSNAGWARWGHVRQRDHTYNF